ncbi:MAG: SpoIID/LytB domain-containing protein [Muribaculaceae bacterium]|nr:SpoIID/LytB domain-containing protein [Muribaculaceae bacterium]
MNNPVPTVQVGIVNAPAIEFELHGSYQCHGEVFSGVFKAGTEGHHVLLQGKCTAEWILSPSDPDTDFFTIKDVTIGVSFHWRRKEDQSFKGALRLIVENGQVTAINIVPVEDYLLSVISSEMSAHASLELLKAHAVISRSWLLAQIKTDEQRAAAQLAANGNRSVMSDEQPDLGGGDADEAIKWWGRDDHVNFDVCADDHCQRYQGITRASTETVRQAIAATWGEVLTHEGALCDARFSKSCGGVMEEFENCWDDTHYDYLEARRDGEDENDFPDLTREEAAEEWILSCPDAFCNTRDAGILSQVLNDYDQETTDFYRWKVEYTQNELSALIAKRTGVDYGRIRDLQPIARGKSGRLYKMKIVGEKLTRTIGKELTIRYALSETALYSSAFVVERHDVDADGYPAKFVLRGAGWGHGVGLCQIGAAVMGAKGYNYRQILAHYFPGAIIDKQY